MEDARVRDPIHTRGNWIEIGQTWRRKYSSGSYTFHSRWTDRHPGKGVHIYTHVYTSRLYRRESWNCSIKQPLGSVQQISPATRVYPVIVGVSPRGFPAKLSSLQVSAENRSRRWNRAWNRRGSFPSLAGKMVGGWKTGSKWKFSIVPREKMGQWETKRNFETTAVVDGILFLYARSLDYPSVNRTKSHARSIIVIYHDNSSAR